MKNGRHTKSSATTCRRSSSRSAPGDEVRAEAGAMMYMTDGDRDGRQDGRRLARRPEAEVPGRRELLHHLLPRRPRPGAKVAFAGPYPGKIIQVDLTGQPDALPEGRVPLRRRRHRPQHRVHQADRRRLLRRRRASSSRRWRAPASCSSTAAAPSCRWSSGRASGCAWTPAASSRSTRRVDYDIVRVGGIKTWLFGGEGLFFASLTGPGRVWLQTLPFSRLADRIHSAYKGDREDVKRDFGGALGGLGDLIGGDR